MFTMLNDWDVSNRMNAPCYNIIEVRTLQHTASNTKTTKRMNVMNGACIILEQLLNKSLLYLPCGHHI